MIISNTNADAALDLSVAQPASMDGTISVGGITLSGLPPNCYFTGAERFNNELTLDGSQDFTTDPTNITLLAAGTNPHAIPAGSRIVRRVVVYYSETPGGGAADRQKAEDLYSFGSVGFSQGGSFAPSARRGYGPSRERLVDDWGGLEYERASSAGSCTNIVAR